MAEISSYRKVAKNTLFLYFRMMFTMIVSLYTSRVNLAVLGIENNGIYQVVGGLVMFFSFMNGSLSGATSRYLTYEIGRDDIKRLTETFSAALMIHIALSLIILILSETVGLWFLNHRLNIPLDRMHAARVVYQFSILSCMMSVVLIPYNALIIAHEKMNIFAYLSILDVSLKLIICYSLYIIPYDKLIVFGLLITIVSIINFIVYYSYCRSKFKECKFKYTKNQNIIKPILSFSGWDLFGNFSVMARTQGVNIIMNLFIGPAINAAVGFATSVGNAVYSFANNFMTAIRPPIVKAYAQHEYIKMQGLMINASKYSFCLILFLSMPFFFESNYIVTLWLKTPPEYTGIFCALDLFLSTASSLFLPLVFAIHATGRIKFMSIVNGAIWFSTVPLTYLLLWLGASPSSAYIIKIFLLAPVVVSNFHSVKKYIPTFDIRLFLREAVIPSSVVLIIAAIFTSVIHKINIHNDLLRLIVTCISSYFSIILCVWIFILDKSQKRIIHSKIHRIIKYAR